MKNILILILLSCFVSCQYFEKNVPSKKDLLSKELKKINWQIVDELPGVSTCNSVDDSEARKKCFFDFVSSSVRNKLLQDSIKLKFPKLDTLQIKVTVSANANVVFDADLSKYKTIYNTNQLDSMFKTKLNNLLAIEPAIKRGVKVKSQFILSIVLD